MKKVLYVPNIGVNLVSVAAIGRGTDLRVNFVGPLVQIAHNNVVVVTGQQGPKPNSLYKLNIVAQVEEEAACIAKQYAAPLLTCHEIYGHVNPKTLLNMAFTESVEGMVIINREMPSVCEGCVLGKLARKEFPTSDREPVTAL